MRDYINIGSSPYGEDCCQVGSPNYGQNARKECMRYIENIIKVCGEPPIGASLVVKGFPHDFGTYYEVVCYYDDAMHESVDYAFHVEGNSPERWDEPAGSRVWIPKEKEETD